MDIIEIMWKMLVIYVYAMIYFLSAIQNNICDRIFAHNVIVFLLSRVKQHVCLLFLRTH